jgi:hypothetical protein
MELLALLVVQAVQLLLAVGFLRMVAAAVIPH